MTSSQEYLLSSVTTNMSHTVEMPCSLIKKYHSNTAVSGLVTFSPLFYHWINWKSSCSLFHCILAFARVRRLHVLWNLRMHIISSHVIIYTRTASNALWPWQKTLLHLLSCFETLQCSTWVTHSLAPTLLNIREPIVCVLREPIVSA